MISLPAIRALARIGPVVLLAHPRVTPLFRMAGFADVVPYAGPAASAGGARQALGLGKRGLARAVVLPRSFSSALRAALARAPERIGVDGEWRGPLLTRRVRIPWAPRARHLSEEFAEVAAAGGAERPLEAPWLDLDAALLDRARGLLASRGISLGGPLVAICPGATFGPAKRWLPDRFGEIVRRARAAGAVPILLGSAADGEVTRAVARASAPAAPEDLAGATDLSALAALLALARVVLTNDSGPMHLAAAVGTPVVALFGSTSPEWTAPLARERAILRYPVPCSPCFRRTCPIGLPCMEGIATDAVWSEVARRLE